MTHKDARRIDKLVKKAGVGIGRTVHSLGIVMERCTEKKECHI